MSIERVPLFPLRSVLFPGGPLPLRIFEARYIDMVGRCMREGAEFGVVLIVSGTETGTAGTVAVGTLARIVDFYQGSDGLLGVTAAGTDRFELLQAMREDDGLNVGDITRWPPEPSIPLPVRFAPMAELLRAILDDLGKLYELLPRQLDDAGWVGCRLAEVLPLPVEIKQNCLEMRDPVERLEFLRPMLRAVREERIQ
ncbi:MAG: peptidase S16 [Gammaproteobacteria bacterium]|nr:peptidase S16 [Gammaproteobacteria bacterium]